MEIINIDPHDIKKASHVLASSFFEYPMFRFYFPDPKRRKRYLPWYFRNILRCAQSYGEVLATIDISGVIFTLAPKHTRLSMWQYIKNGFFLTPILLGFKNYVHSMECEEIVADIHEKLLQNRPHIYLWGLAVDPEKKFEGIGKALLQTVLLKANAQKLPVYLETHNEKNVDYYRKHGFELIHTATIPKHNLTIWCMVREL